MNETGLLYSANSLIAHKN